MELGRLTEVDIRSVWAHEARDFTPWLLDHADHLEEILGIELELKQSEHPVGSFSLDLVGRDISNDAVLIVENQLEGTNHTHLGQILTYAAGTDASTIVWLSTSFREEHRQAIDWLNEQTGVDVRFFGIEVQAVRIGDSPPAPLFKLVAQPNAWQKQVRATARAVPEGSKSALYRDFWAKYLERLHAEHPEWSAVRKPQAQNWMDFRSPIRGTHISLNFPTGQRLRHELYVDTGDEEQTAETYNGLLGKKEAIEAAYGRPLEWEELPERRASRIADYREGSDIHDESAHDDFISWFLDAGARLRTVFDALVTD